jgi:hypothetical protein
MAGPKRRTTRPGDSALRAKITKLQKNAERDRVVLPFSADVVFKITWLAPEAERFASFDELEDVRRELKGWLPLGKADGRCIMTQLRPPHAVAVFDDGFQTLAGSLDAFFRDILLAKGEKAPLAKLEAAVDRAEAKLDGGKAKEALRILEEALAPYKTMPDPKRDLVADNEDALGRGFLLLGIAAHECGDDDRSLRAYMFGQAFLNFTCGGNIQLLHLDHQRYADAISFGSDLLAEWERKIPLDEELDIRGRVLAARWLSGNAKTAEKEAAAWVKRAKATKKERKLLLDVLADAFDGKAPEALKAAKRLLA